MSVCMRISVGLFVFVFSQLNRIFSLLEFQMSYVYRKFSLEILLSDSIRNWVVICVYYLFVHIT